MKRCQNCGFENDSTMNFCLECGTPLRTSPLTNAKTEYQPVNPQSIPTVVLVLLGIAGALFLANRLSKENVAVKTPTPAVSPTRKVSPTPQKSAGINLSNASAETPEIEVNVSPNPNFTPPTEPTARGVFNVKADKNWQLSNLDVIGGEKFVLLALGAIDLREIEKGVSPEGVADKKYQSRRLFAEFPTRALLMRTRYADGKYSKISAVALKKASGVWQNAPDEFGKLEFCINDNAPDGNKGEFVVSIVAFEE
ncbi:MAG: zinc ribbon domain-containing protein [Acidobacteria bacterium]|nr:zinc ribbon domain-containing protein [Acidobacteriota bacterium]